jgi:hypothetical protein
VELTALADLALVEHAPDPHPERRVALEPAAQDSLAQLLEFHLRRLEQCLAFAGAQLHKLRITTGDDPNPG